ncbi:MAG: hypothetical protein CL557_10730 [Alphaproteobacteria bacterium]|nr:hypothetical protein [Alphaproteobacteria bacterium]|tara:strand:- start:957 stop:1361 length:405 start_codon:yes stop_codon:yes gene_type:complete
MSTIIKNEEWLELYSELASYVENKLFPDRKTHDDDGNRIDETSNDFCEICNDIEEILSGVLTMEDLKAPAKLNNKISILWGEVPDEGQEAITYKFKTKAELDAFNLGIAETLGWNGLDDSVEEGHIHKEEDDAN